MERQRVFITGIGLISSIGNEKDAALASLRNLRHGFSPFPEHARDAAAGVQLVGSVKGFDVDSTDFEDWTIPPPYKMKREMLRSMPPHGPYAYCSMLQAIEDARLAEVEISNADTGIYTASGGSPRLTYNNFVRMRQVGPMRCPPTSIVSAIAGTLSFNLVACFKILGHSCGFSSACASSGHALGFAFDDIALGRQKRMFVVAGEDLNYESVVPFTGMRALSLEGEPERASCPFDKRRNGFVSAGGGVALVLESEDEVARRGAEPYAQLLGWGQASDGHNVAMSHPEGVGLRAAMDRALASAGVDAAAIDYVNAHATSTLIGDASEGMALQRVFTDRGHAPRISSTKALTGHGLSLASALEIALVALSMRAGITPGSAHIHELDTVFEGLDIIRETLSEPPTIALSNSSGFGGANVSIALRRC